ncbi:hypothetical protein NMY22_g15857 [Coprinellus aureogranulatus]|nr:hypothetical protein NMY22_g15857 [Coprinellus aureogranulatus]
MSSSDFELDYKLRTILPKSTAFRTLVNSGRYDEPAQDSQGRKRLLVTTLGDLRRTKLLISALKIRRI